MWTLTIAVVCFLAASTKGASDQECGETIREEGTLQSPDPFDDQYKKHQSMECVWHIEAPENKRVVLKISKYAIGKALFSCNSIIDDYIAVFDGNTTDEEKRLALLCTKGQDFVIPASGNTLTVKFKTQIFNEMPGFISQVVFTFPEFEGCGGNVNLNSDTSYAIQTPIVRNYEEGDAFECIWNFKAPNDHAIKVSFSSFDKFPCKLNHFVEIRDGVVPDSLLLGTYCGKNLPPVVVSSSNKLSIRFSSMQKSQFQATVTVQKAACSLNLNFVYDESRQYKSPGYDSGSLERGINCGYEFQSGNKYSPVRLTIKNLDIQPGSQPGKCDKDKLIIGTRNTMQDLGQYYTSNYDTLNYINPLLLISTLYDGNVYSPRQFDLCGQKSAEFFFPDTFTLNLITTPGSVPKSYKGFEIEVSFAKFCGRNYSEPYGRILSGRGGSRDDCYTLISGPEGHTISLYFISFTPTVSMLRDLVYVDVYDGKTTDSPKIMSTKSNNTNSGKPTVSPKIISTKSNNTISMYNLPSPIFSRSNYILIKNKRVPILQTGFDLNYMTTNKGRGCGGNYYGDQGVVSSPLYPETYKERKTCEWEIETPASTLIHIIFDDFDFNSDCHNNYVELRDRSNKKLVRLCSGKLPSAFKSIDNYVKIVYVTSPNNSGKGWHAKFRAGECLRCRHQTMKPMESAVSRLG